MRNKNSIVARKELPTYGATAKSERSHSAAVVSKLNAMRFVGEANVLELGSHVSITHFSLFKPPVDALFVELKTRDRRCAKKVGYKNAADVWLETKLTRLQLARETDWSV